MALATKEETMKMFEEGEAAAAAEMGEGLVTDFLEMMDTYHSLPEQWDDALARNIAAMNYEILRNPAPLAWPKKRGVKFFTPSSANSCKRELFHRIRGDKRDEIDTPPHQGRWRRLGSLFGEMIQTDLIYIEKHYQRLTGQAPAFVPDRIEVNGRRFPFWEGFAKKIHHVNHNGHDLYLMGQPDGVLIHKSGIRVGLEIKSKQTTPAVTSFYSMRAAKEDHVRQCIAYSIMYGVDDFLIVYGNLAKKGWDMTPEEYEKNPDLRAFHIHVTEAERLELLDTFASVMQAVKTDTPPAVDPFKWTFNNFKTATALSMTEEELADLRRKVRQVQKSTGLPKWMKDNVLQCWMDIREIREAEGMAS
jgi:hypothetical protein